MELKKDRLIRLRFIDAFLHRYGTFSRSLLVDIFGISLITASRDLETYRELQPSLEYDRSRKVFTMKEKRLVIDLWFDFEASHLHFLTCLGTIYDVQIGWYDTQTLGVKKR